VTAVSVACLTIYDMAKAADRMMEIGAFGFLQSRAAGPAISGMRSTRHELLPVSDAKSRILPRPPRLLAPRMLPLAEVDGRVWRAI